MKLQGFKSFIDRILGSFEFRQVSLFRFLTKLMFFFFFFHLKIHSLFGQHGGNFQR